jgi:hypothetical protein
MIVEHSVNSSIPGERAKSRTQESRRARAHGSIRLCLYLRSLTPRRPIAAAYNMGVAAEPDRLTPSIAHCLANRVARSPGTCIGVGGAITRLDNALVALAAATHYRSD